MSLCPQCGARNPAENTTCRSCGAVLGLEPAAPVSGARPAAEQRCAQCGTALPPGAAVMVRPPEGGAPVPFCVACEAELKVRATRLDQPGNVILPAAEEGAAPVPAVEAQPAALPEEESQPLPLARAALFGLGAAVVLGAIWFLIETMAGLSVSFMVFVVGWLVALAVTFGAGRRRGRPLQWIALALTVVTVLAVRFLVSSRDDPAGFPAALWSWFQSDPLTMIFVLLGLWYSFSTPGRRPQRRPPEQPAEKEVEESASAAEGEEEKEAPGGPPAESAVRQEDPARRCVRCQAQIAPGEALLVPGGFRRGTLLLCPQCTGEIEARFAAETENVQIGPALLFGIGGAALFAALWYALGLYTDSPFVAIIGFAAGWILPEVIRFGAGRKRGRTLQWIAVGLTFALIVGVNLALAFRHPEGLAAGLVARFSDPLTDVIYLLALFQAFTGPAPRKLGGIRESDQQQSR